MPSSQQNDKSIFNAARLIHSEEDRREYLQRVCADDSAQIDRVTALLRGFKQNSQFLESPAVRLLPPLADFEVVVRAGTQIGPYTIREPLGEGGMGVVYAAEQKEPVRRKVALKIIKPGMDSKEVLARFDVERQALALMSHPNIANILDGGTTHAGRPYFVMELVRGIAITKFCNAHKLNLRARLNLFVTVCQAVQHAHLKGIIHRDLKPSNVLVELHDIAAMPKVIDFGIAKATNQQLTQQTVYTQFSQLLGTPLYMSPEQAQLSGLDIDTRSDVYSLGVILYELLAGTPPFDERTLGSVGVDEWRRIIREDEPQRPSYKVSTLDHELMSTISDQRRTKPRELSLSMQRELDWIVMKTLEKDRDRRYESASALAADVQRYLDDKPVEACPPSATYRLNKFARRNATTIVATGLVAAALIVGTSVSVWQAREANDARQLADERFVEADAQRRNADIQRRSAELAAKRASQKEEFSQQLVYAADVQLAAQAWHSGDVRRFTDLLDRHSHAASVTDRRGFEWYYLRQFAVADFRNIATQTGGSCVARFTRDGKTLVTGRHDGSLCFWDGQSYEPLATVRGLEGLVRGIDFAPDGIGMASIGDDGMIRLWDLRKRKQIRSFQAHDNHGFRVYFVDGGKVLASCGEDTSVWLWNAATGEALGELEGYARTVERAAMDRSPDGRWCASGDPIGLAYVWNTQTHQRLCMLDLGVRDGRACRAACMCFSPDGQFIAVGTDEHLIRICDAHTGEQVATLTGHEDDLQAVTFHPSRDMLASSDHAGVIRVWPLNLGSEADGAPEGTDDWPAYFQGHAARAWSLDFSPDGTRLVSASKDGTVRSWSGRAQKNQRIQQPDDEINAATFVSDGAGMFIAGDKNLYAWDTQTEELKSFSDAIDQVAMCVAVSPDGMTCVTGHFEGIIRIWSCETGRLQKMLTVHEASVDHAVFSCDGGLLATGSWDGTVKLWDVASNRQLTEFVLGPHCYSLAFSPDGRLLACTSESDAMLFDVTSRKRLHLLQGHRSTADCIAFSPCGKLLATGSHDRTIRIWNVATGEVLHVIAAHRDEIHSLTFSPDGRTLASGGGMGTIAFSHVETGRFLFDTKVANYKVRGLEFSPDGKSLAATCQKEGVILLHTPQIAASNLAQPSQSQALPSAVNDFE